MKPKIILCESRVDFKYSSIFNITENFVLIEGTYLNLLKQLLKNRNSIYHIRYITYRGRILTFIRIFIIFVLCKLSKGKIIWSCHNIYEHNIPSKKYNDFIRVVICALSNQIIVFHKDLIKFLPIWAQKKTHVATFGNFRKFIESQDQTNPDFAKKYKIWLEHNNSGNPNLVSISAAKRNNLERLIKGVSGSKINTLVVAPNFNLKTNVEGIKNLMFYNKFVHKEVGEILDNTNQLVGFVGHENLSVPTSVYMFASFGIPIISFDYEPINSLVLEYEIGEVIVEETQLPKVWEKIQNNYDFYSKKCRLFLEENSWEKSAKVHSKIFR